MSTHLDQDDEPQPTLFTVIGVIIACFWLWFVIAVLCIGVFGCDVAQAVYRPFGYTRIKLGPTRENGHSFRATTQERP